ncbi:hypothetical protein D1006_29385 [Burkholderia stabilis]|uniref:Uncharacterized protein n=1 Tax=Burkholderia stabilis TaxID=95485 RepID=A0A4Q2AID3_9BURK|nr:hypothetical protein D1006_29385 [Burkholderia stabilis]
MEWRNATAPNRPDRMQEVRGVYHKQTAWSVYIRKWRCYDRLLHRLRPDSRLFRAPVTGTRSLPAARLPGR